ncbi:MAG: hypothetical protein HYY32_05845 [Chloroflexi bacterium]|nr:hypothetical protein [Chloroflexota bacterium]
MRASTEVEKCGLPSVSLVCDSFAAQAQATAAGLGAGNLPLAAYPGPVNLHGIEEMQRNVVSVVVDQVVRAFTVQPKQVVAPGEPAPRDVVFKGTLDEVNSFYYDREWSDGLPVVPPTVDRVGRFLGFTDRGPEEVIGVLLPDSREATVWNVAVNGVMAGCRPEYMPVLLAIVSAMCDPKFGQEHLGHTPGAEVLITLNGPVIKDLGFNYEQGVLRVGFQANTSIGRFWRLYMRNVAGFLPHKTDKATFGGTWRVVLAENEEAVARIGWQPMSVDQGFEAGANVVTVSSCTSSDSMFAVGPATAEEILNKLATRVMHVNLWLFALSFYGPGIRPQVLLSPCVAELLARAGYSKNAVKEYLFNRARFPVRLFETLRPDVGTVCDSVEQGALPALYCESRDPDRMVPVVWSPDDFMITVSGDPGRDNCFICGQNGFIGYPVSKRIELPAGWAQRMKSRGRK